ncbi:hypothetical protein NX784_16485 [Massilia pinisoli]|uniref:Secreted protein n=1 Tax=Massilia pinisoli TaxID=1772194 RepID=A0ABT1ZU56_9BURK|nr:hypothetical protein [Massilia pinisoli]MCS0583189.1 hypothetical protein [Massilia pinisoli]
MNTIKRLITCAVATFALLSSFSAHADEETGWRKIVDIGCHHVGGTCFVALDGAAFGASLGCPGAPTNQFRFDDGNTVTGRRTDSTLLAAAMSGKSVSIHLTGCSSQGTPTLAWYHVQP